MTAVRKHWGRASAVKPRETAPAIETTDERPGTPSGRVLRVMRVYPGERVLRVLDLRGAVTQLDMIARYVEQLIAEDKEKALDYVMRSRSFKEAFASKAKQEHELRTAILWALSERPDSSEYAPLIVEGYSAEQVDAMLFQLWRAGYIDAAIPKVERVLPGTLTTKGFTALKKIGTKGDA